ncbi:MAG: N-6 DNA methylase [Flavipsychrobacter sp.]|nr:N-6 DNA methylase [Flavipsychrobacter sp.]
MAQSTFKNNIASLDFTIKKGNESGVVFVSEYRSNSTNMSPHEMFALETAKEFQADAVYFRYFEDGRESIPQVYIYDNTNGILNGREADIHIKVWSGCYIPIFIFVEKDQVKIFDAREKVKIQGDDITTTPIETIVLAGRILEQFSAKDFDSGLFWEEKKNQGHFQFTSSAYKELIDGLKRVYEDFQITSNLNSHVALKLLVQCLLIKYLEERDEESGNGYFAKTFFKNHFGCNNFCEVIRKGQLLDLLDKLSQNFNGKIFEWSKIDEKKERLAIGNAKVKKLADYLDGNSKNDQYVLWRLYSFSHLPVELISSVYEELLGKGKKDTVYTPDMIASTLIDECMPIKAPQKDFKIIDISCGSGIFLVKAYKRTIQWWRYSKWLETGVLEKPNEDTLKALLVNSIYGIDVQGDAVRLAIFSLALALLDELDPKTIWTKLRFENLNHRNVIEKDFFEFLSNEPPTDFSLVIGNPPFNPPGGIANGKYKLLLKESYQYEPSIKIPDHNIALMFLAEGIKLLKPSGLLCLIQPSAPLLYQDDNSFIKEVFANYNLLQVIDFTKLGNVLWGSANVATAAVFVQNTPPDNSPIAHITVKDSIPNTKKIFLELDHYDFHFISKETALTNPFIWKADFIGGGRIGALVERLSKLRTLQSYLEEKENSGWVVGEGFQESEKGQPADYITGRDYLPTEAFSENGIDWKLVHKCEVTKFHRAKNSKLYSPPHILLKANIGKQNLLVQYSDRYVVFRDKIIGIHAPKKDKENLVKLYDYLIENNDLLRFYIACTSSQVLVNRATALLKEDLMRVPYPEEISEINISQAERILISDVLKYQLNSDNKTKLYGDVSEPELKNFSKVFTKTLNSIYQTEGRQFQLFKILDAGNYYALHFEYSSDKITSTEEKNADLEQYLQHLIPDAHKKKSHLHIQRILKFYSKDSIVLSKPKQLRYWLQSTALRDADESFADYIKAGF